MQCKAEHSSFNSVQQLSESMQGSVLSLDRGYQMFNQAADVVG